MAYYEDDDDDDTAGGSSHIVQDGNVQGPRPAKRRATLLNIFEYHMSCGVCQYPCNEVVTTSCGHRFCRECLNISKKKWGKQRCPSCDATVTSVVRLYDDDRMIGSLLDSFAPELEGLYASIRRRKQYASIQDGGQRHRVREHRYRGILGLDFLVIVSILLVTVGFWYLLFSGALERLQNPKYCREQTARIKSIAQNAFLAVRDHIIGILLKLERYICVHCLSNGRGFLREDEADC